MSLGSNTSLPPVRELLLHSDVVLAIGTELGETDYDVWLDGNLRIDGTLIRIDIDPEQLNRNIVADVAILSDAKLAICALLARLGTRNVHSAEESGDTPYRRGACAPRGAVVRPHGGASDARSRSFRTRSQM